jgi:hypothetical protein
LDPLRLRLRLRLRLGLGRDWGLGMRLGRRLPAALVPATAATILAAMVVITAVLREGSGRHGKCRQPRSEGDDAARSLEIDGHCRSPSHACRAIRSISPNWVTRVALS